MRNFARVWLLLVLALVSIGLLVVSSAWLSQLTPLGAALTDQGFVVHALSGKALTLTAAVLFFGLLETVFLPFLNIREVMFGAGPWAATGEDGVRAAVILGWFLVFAAVIVGFAWGGAL